MAAHVPSSKAKRGTILGISFLIQCFTNCYYLCYCCYCCCSYSKIVVSAFLDCSIIPISSRSLYRRNRLEIRTFDYWTKYTCSYSCCDCCCLFLANHHVGHDGHHDTPNTPEEDTDTRSRSNISLYYHTLPRIYVGRESLATTINTDVVAATGATTLDNDDNAPNIAREEQLESLLLQQNLERQLGSSQTVIVTGSSTMSLSTSLLETDAILSLSTKQTHYLAKVMRILSKPKNNQNVLLRVFDGINGEWLCRVIPESSCTSNDAYTTATPSSSASGTSKSRKKSFSSNQSRNRSSLRIQCIRQLRPQIEQDEMPETPWLFFAPIKSKRMRLIIEKCTELGVGMFCPVVTEYTDSTAVAAYSAMIGGVELGEDGKCHNEHDFTTNNHDSILYHGGSTSASASAKKQKSTDGESERLFVIACEAAEQCERLTIPKFVNLLEGQTPGMIISFHKFLKKWNQRQKEENNPRVLLVCRERSKERNNAYSLLEAMDRVAAWNKNVAFLVGPEGGWSPEEDSLLDRYCDNYPKSIMGVTLGSNVLRTETASILAVGSFSLWFDQKQMC